MKTRNLFYLFLFLSSYCFSQELISEGKTAWASSEENADGKASNAVDGKSNTRWESKHQDHQWWAIDLEKEYHIFGLEIDWETAYASEYKIEIADNSDFDNAIQIAQVKNSPGGHEIIATDITSRGRYLRLTCITRNTGYGCSFWELRILGQEQLVPTTVTIDIPYVQYLKTRMTPAANNNQNEIEIQNNNGGTTVKLEFNEGAPLRMDLLDFRGNYDIDFWTYKEGTMEKITGIPFIANVYRDMVIHVELTERKDTRPQAPIADAGRDITIYSPTTTATLNAANSQDRDGLITAYQWEQLEGPNTATLHSPNQVQCDISNLVIGEYKFKLSVTDDTQLTGSDEVLVLVLPAEQIDFTLATPANKSMITDTRTPTLSWEACPGASKYEVYMNISRSDYNWYASGNLLDRYTKIGETTTNSYLLTDDLPDRWTYKWYVIATTADGPRFSDKKQFGLYLPALATETDGIVVVDGCRDLNKNGTIEPYENWRLTPEERVNDLMSRLSEKEKFCQLFYGGNDAPLDGFAFSYGVESGMREAQYNAMKTPHGIPIAFLGDKAHGWKTIYPTQLGLAATRDMNIAYQCGNLHRVEQKSFGFTGTLAPLAEVSTKVLYPRIQEGGGENADEVAAMIRAMVCGMQGGPEINPHSMLVTVKHWPGQGAGGEGPTQYDEVTIKYHMKPWYATVDANAASVMPGYSSSPYLDPSETGSNSSKAIIDFLKNEIRFNGFTVTDWLIANTEVSTQSISAGIDVMGGAPSHLTNMNELIANVGIDRIDEAVRKVLDMKIRLGMFENPYGDPTCTWTNALHHPIVLNAARKSITLLKNDKVLPLKLSANSEMVVAGARATWSHQFDDPNTIWQSVYYENPQAKDYLQAISDRAGQAGVIVKHDNSNKPQVAIVVIGENAYTHGTEWDDKSPNIPNEQMKTILDFKAQGVKVVTVVILPRPYVLTPVIEHSDAVLVVYRGGNGIAQATAECLFGDFAPTGKLPFQLPVSQEQIGTDDLNNQVEKWELPYDLGAQEYERMQIRAYIERDEPVPPIFGNPLFQYGFGLANFGNETDHPTTIGQPADQADGEPMVYSHPADGFIHIKCGNSDDRISRVCLHSLTGHLLVDKEVNNTSSTELETPCLGKGIYILSVYYNDKVVSRKVLR